MEHRNLKILIVITRLLHNPNRRGYRKLSGRDHGIRKSCSIRDQPVRSEELSGNLQGIPDMSQPIDEIKDDNVARNDYWSMEENYIYRHLVELRVQLYGPKEETFPIPQRYIDVTRTTRTTLDVLQESRFDYYWNIDVNRNLPKSWTRFTKFTILIEKLPQGFMWSSGRLAKIQATTRPDHRWPAIWSSTSKASERKENQQ